MEKSDNGEDNDVGNGGNGNGDENINPLAQSKQRASARDTEEEIAVHAARKSRYQEDDAGSVDIVESNSSPSQGQGEGGGRGR